VERGKGERKEETGKDRESIINNNKVIQCLAKGSLFEKSAEYQHSMLDKVNDSDKTGRMCQHTR